MVKKRPLTMLSIIAGFILVLAFSACVGNDSDDDDPNGGNSGNNGGNNGGKTPGNTQENAIPVTVGYSSSHTITQSGTHWFSFTGTGEPVIFETRGSVVDTYMEVLVGYARYRDDNDGEGYNALYSINPTTSGTTYFISIETRNSTSGTYTFVVTAPTVNIRTNPIPVTVGHSSSRTIHSSGQHWFSFQGTGDSVVFETQSNVVETTISLYIGDSTNAILTDNTRISFSTLSGTTYYINITGNSGTYTFNVRDGTGDGSSRSYAIPVTVGYSSPHTITQNGTHWFSFTGTGSTVTFETKGSVVDTYMEVLVGGYARYRDDNNGEGYNALVSFNPTTSGTTYFISIETRNSTSGTYTLVVRSVS
jgi:hypothetical protein